MDSVAVQFASADTCVALRPLEPPAVAIVPNPRDCEDAERTSCFGLPSTVVFLLVASGKEVES